MHVEIFEQNLIITISILKKYLIEPVLVTTYNLNALICVAGFLGEIQKETQIKKKSY